MSARFSLIDLRVDSCSTKTSIPGRHEKNHGHFAKSTLKAEGRFVYRYESSARNRLGPIDIRKAHVVKGSAKEGSDDASGRGVARHQHHRRYHSVAVNSRAENRRFGKRGGRQGRCKRARDDLARASETICGGYGESDR